MLPAAPGTGSDAVKPAALPAAPQKVAPVPLPALDGKPIPSAVGGSGATLPVKPVSADKGLAFPAPDRPGEVVVPLLPGEAPPPKKGEPDPVPLPKRPGEATPGVPGVGEEIPVAPTIVPKKDKKEAKKSRLRGKITPEDEELLGAAQNAVNLRDYVKAAEYFARFLARNPGEYDVRADYAGLLVTAGEIRKAIAVYEQVVANAPTMILYRLRLGDAYVIDGQYKQGAAQFMYALQLASSDVKLRDRIPEIAVRLARTYAYDGDILRATQVFERYLARIKPEDENAPAALGALLLDLERPQEAIPYLLARRKILLKDYDPRDPAREQELVEVLASLVRGLARVGERHQAMEALNEMAGKAIDMVNLRIDLGNTLFGYDEFEIAGHVFNQVLQADPANGAALIGIARVHLETFQPANAKRILDSFVPNALNQRGYLMSYSSYHQSVGEYTEAKQIYRDMLRRNDADTQVRFALGRVYQYTKEWEKAKAEYAKIPPTDRMAKQARLYFALTLGDQRKFVEAIQVLNVLLTEDPNNAAALAYMTRYQAKAGMADKAIHAARAYLATNPRNEFNAATVRLALARVLLDANKVLDAVREYEIALSRPAGRLPEAYYGLALAANKLNNPECAGSCSTWWSATWGAICGPASCWPTCSRSTSRTSRCSNCSTPCWPRTRRTSPSWSASPTPSSGRPGCPAPRPTASRRARRSCGSRRPTCGPTWPWPGRSPRPRTTARRPPSTTS